MNPLKLVVSERFQLAEGPQWLADSNQLLWVDIEGKAVHLLSLATKEHEVITMPQRVGAALPASSGSIICALEDGLYEVLPDRSIIQLAELESDIPSHRCNDGKIDEAGRLWIGTMPMGGSEWTGSLYSYSSAGQLTRHVDQLGCSNGMDWSVDGRTMYFIDSPTRRVDAFDYDPVSGKITNRRPVVQFDESLGVPDGMCTDAQGRLWVAHWGGYCVTCHDPLTGEELQQIKLPASQVTSCCFGGPDLKTLFITTASVGLSEERLKEEPLAGSVFSIEVDAVGKLNPRFQVGN